MNIEPNKTIVIFNSIKFLIPFFNEKGIRTYHIYKEVGFVSRIFRKIFSLLKLDRSYWLGDWKYAINDRSVSHVILFANDEKDVWRKLDRSSLKVVFWYWNPVYIYNEGVPQNLPRSFVPYSFDPKDCENYKINFNTTFYFNNITLGSNREITYDILFVGLDKGRGADIENLRQEFEKLGLVSFIYIVGKRTSTGTNRGNKSIPYELYLDYVARSKVILDLVQKRQSGLTVRVMESIFFRKKLVTNDISIQSQPFYHSSNIFIIGKDDISQLSEFINGEYILLDSSVVDHYDVLNWLKRFSK